MGDEDDWRVCIDPLSGTSNEQTVGISSPKRDGYGFEPDDHAETTSATIRSTR